MQRYRLPIDRFRVVESSMEPSLRPGDHLLAVRPAGRATRGSLVVFEHPIRPGFMLVKRVVGLPGETVTVRDGVVSLDGDPTVDVWGAGPTLPDSEWETGPGELFVLSDNRGSTRADGRSFGPIPARSAYRVVWPRR
jgi:signal peptidase I